MFFLHKNAQKKKKKKKKKKIGKETDKYDSILIQNLNYL